MEFLYFKYRLNLATYQKSSPGILFGVGHAIYFSIIKASVHTHEHIVYASFPISIPFFITQAQIIHIFKEFRIVERALAQNKVKRIVQYPFTNIQFFVLFFIKILMDINDQRKMQSLNIHTHTCTHTHINIYDRICNKNHITRIYKNTYKCG